MDHLLDENEIPTDHDLAEELQGRIIELNKRAEEIKEQQSKLEKELFENNQEWIQCKGKQTEILKRINNG